MAFSHYKKMHQAVRTDNPCPRNRDSNMLKVVSGVFLLFVGISQSFAQSYRSLYESENRSKATYFVNQACRDSLRPFLQSGGSLKIEDLLKQAKKVTVYKVASHKRDRIFYHYTNSQELKKIVETTGRLDEMLAYSRLYGRDGVDIYVAEDPITSAHYGSIQIKIKMKKEAIVLDSYMQNKDVLDSTFEELMNSNKIMCNDPSRLYNLIAEESGIDLIDYYSEKKWFQLIKIDNVESVTIGSFGKW